MKAVILAAGYGTRIVESAQSVPEWKEYITNTPKPLLEIAGKPLLTHIVEKLSAVKGLDGVRVVINNNSRYLPQFQEWHERIKDSYGFAITLVNDQTDTIETRLGSVRDLSVGLGLEGQQYGVSFAEDNYIVVNGDRWPSFNLEDAVEVMRSQNATVLGVYNEGTLDDMKGKSQVVWDETGRVTQFVEKAQDPTVVGSTHSAPGFYFFTPWDLKWIPKFLARGNNTDAPGFFIQYLHDNEIPLFVFEMPSNSFDFGDLNDYLRAKEILEGQLV